MNRATMIFALALAALTGCSSYTWKSSVPAGMRSVSVPTFRNETAVTGFGSVAARQVLREIQREGTFAVSSGENAAIEIQGVLKSASSSTMSYRRQAYSRGHNYNFDVVAEVSFIDVRSGKILVNNRRYKADTSYFIDDDKVTGQRDASGRAADDLARQIVDDLVSMEFNNPEESK